MTATPLREINPRKRLSPRVFRLELGIPRTNKPSLHAVVPRVVVSGCVGGLATGFGLWGRQSAAFSCSIAAAGAAVNQSEEHEEGLVRRMPVNRNFVTHYRKRAEFRRDHYARHEQFQRDTALPL